MNTDNEDSGRSESETNTDSSRTSAPHYTILLAEDNLANQGLLKLFLQRSGHTVITANNGKEVLDLFGKTRYDVILMDVEMPVINGMETAKIIRAKEKASLAKPVPIIALTAHAMKGDKERFIATGMNDYVSKPIDLDRLVRLIDSFLHHQPKENPQ